jgi:predicted RNase H-like HicB family nuclease
MTGEFTAIVERDGDLYIAYCAEIPGANGQGRTKAEAKESLAKAIELMLADRRGLSLPESGRSQASVQKVTARPHLSALHLNLLR